MASIQQVERRLLSTYEISKSKDRCKHDFKQNDIWAMPGRG